VVIDPEDVDWSEVDDSEVWHAAKSGIPEAVAEAEKRGLNEPLPQPLH
jgi:hypothetical protein